MTGPAPPTASSAGGRSTASSATVIVAFAAVYLMWGSTFLATRLAVRTLPPWTLIGVRSTVAGLILFGFALGSGAPRPTRRQWLAALGAGTLMFTVGHGLLAWGVARVPSGQAALLIGTLPLWIPLAGWLLGVGRRPPARIALGLAGGFAGVGLLVGPRAGGGAPDVVGVAALLASALAWAFGTAVSRRGPSPSSPLLSAGMQLIAGGVLALAAAMAGGEWERLTLEDVSRSSLLSLAYLIVFGSIVAHSAFVWLLGTVSAEKVSTYAYVNPVVALLLGHALLDEAVGPREIGAGVLILSAVALVLTTRSPPH